MYEDPGVLVSSSHLLHVVADTTVWDYRVQPGYDQVMVTRCKTTASC